MEEEVGLQEMSRYIIILKSRSRLGLAPLPFLQPLVGTFGCAQAQPLRSDERAPPAEIRCLPRGKAAEGPRWSHLAGSALETRQTLSGVPTQLPTPLPPPRSIGAPAATTLTRLRFPSRTRGENWRAVGCELRYRLCRPLHFISSPASAVQDVADSFEVHHCLVISSALLVRLLCALMSNGRRGHARACSSLWLLRRLTMRFLAACG